MNVQLVQVGDDAPSPQVVAEATTSDTGVAVLRPVSPGTYAIRAVRHEDACQRRWQVTRRLESNADPIELTLSEDFGDPICPDALAQENQRLEQRNATLARQRSEAVQLGERAFSAIEQIEQLAPEARQQVYEDFGEERQRMKELRSLLNERGGLLDGLQPRAPVLDPPQENDNAR